MSAISQTMDLPPNAINTRHFTDQYVTMRPAMSLRGFDNSTISSSDPHRFQIYGVKQVLEKAFGIGQTVDSSVVNVLTAIRIEAFQPLVTATTPVEVESNFSIMKSKAAYALLSYVVSKNDGDSEVQ